MKRLFMAGGFLHFFQKVTGPACQVEKDITLLETNGEKSRALINMPLAALRRLAIDILIDALMPADGTECHFLATKRGIHF